VPEAPTQEDRLDRHSGIVGLYRALLEVLWAFTFELAYSSFWG
jgi:hypothetical protein